MSGIERWPSEEPSDQPEREQIPAYEIDLTGVVRQTNSLTEVIIDAIVEAGDDGEVPEWGARAIARYLANLQEDRTTALHHFAVTGRIDIEAMGTELAELWRVHSRREFTADAINRLGTYLIAAHHAEREQREASYSPELQALIAEHGAAFRAYLTLPDVSASAPLADLRVSFHEHYATAYDSPEDLVAEVVTSLGLDRQLAESDVDHFAGIDPVKVLRLAYETYTVVPMGGRYYCFWK